MSVGHLSPELRNGTPSALRYKGRTCAISFGGCRRAGTFLFREGGWRAARVFRPLRRATAHGILRHNGLQIGKKDYIETLK